MAWEQLLRIADEARALRQAELSQPPVACPHDGTPLRAGPRGVLYCPEGNYEYPRDDTRPRR